MSILTILSTVYLFCLAQYLGVEALDAWADGMDAASAERRLERWQYAGSAAPI